MALDLNAISMLSSYRWPGNVRQLKSVAETVSALESRPVRAGVEKVEIGPDALSRYLPDEQDTLLPAQASPVSGQGAMNPDEKAAIVKSILDLKRDVENLKIAVQSGVVQQGTVDAVPPQIHAEHLPVTHIEDPEEQIAGVEEAEPQPPMNMKRMRDELIEHALQRHDGNVALAAKELGISDRTIYRKLAAKKKAQ